MRIVHISDPHGFHENLKIPECDILICSGDVGAMRTTLQEFNLFLIWFEKQPAILKILVAGNHDVLLDKKYISQQPDSVSRLLADQAYRDAKKLIESYNIKYLENEDYVYEGLKIYGSPFSPTFGYNWAFNADRGLKIKNIWGKIPKDTDILITHTPVYGILDRVEERYRKFPGEDMNVGCKDLFDVIKNRLSKLKLHCSGHIHDNYGVIKKNVSNTRKVLFSNGAVIDNQANMLIEKPFVINL